MNEGMFKELLEKYQKGTSTLIEEQLLSKNAENLTSASLPWFKFIQHNKRKAPEGLKDSVWETIQNKRIIKRRLNIGILSVAASVMLFLSISIYNPLNKNLSYKKKEALLSEALSMFENTENKTKVEHNSIYEDEMIIIYASAE